jgi:Mce-associated membrane protein
VGGLTERTGTWRGWPWVNALLGVLVLALVVYLLVLLAAGSRAAPGTTKGERAEQRYDDVRAAVSKGIEAFLRVDYKNMDPLLDAVLDGSTGTFKQQYAATRSSLKSAAQQAKATSTGTIKQIGVSELKGDQATVFVAADAVVTNSTTTKNPATATCPHKGAGCRFYRLKVGMTDTSDGWKISSLDFVS